MANSHPCFAKTLLYTSPAHGGWGLVRVGMLVPESFQLFIAPAACGRHGAISAYQHGYKDRLAYYFLEEQDIISGSYEQQILQAVEQVLSRLAQKPQAILLFVTCIDDLMATDLESLTIELAQRFCGIDFSFCHMNPIRNESKLPPPAHIQQQIFRLLKSTDNQLSTVNCIGNLLPIDGQCELYSFLHSLGISQIKHISQCKTYAQFQTMATAACNLVLSPNGLAAAKRMKADLGIPYLELPVSYALDNIDQQYEQLQQALGKTSSMDLSVLRQQAEQEIAQTRQLLGDLPILLDGAAVAHPFALAWFLYQQGFSVAGVFAEQPTGQEKHYMQQILEYCPQIKIQPPRHPRTMLRSNQTQQALAIGFEAAYITQSRYVMDLLNDETMFGYHGVCKFMKMLRNSYISPNNLQDLINAYGLVI